MSHFGTAMKVLFYPMRLITVPLVWLFKHRCKLDAEGCCIGIFCGVGKVGNPNWTNYNRAGEWTRMGPRPALPKQVTPPPKRNCYRCSEH